MAGTKKTVEKVDTVENTDIKKAPKRIRKPKNVSTGSIAQDLLKSGYKLANRDEIRSALHRMIGVSDKLLLTEHTEYVKSAVAMYTQMDYWLQAFKEQTDPATALWYEGMYKSMYKNKVVVNVEVGDSQYTGLNELTTNISFTLSVKDSPKTKIFNLDGKKVKISATSNTAPAIKIVEYDLLSSFKVPDNIVNEITNNPAIRPDDLYVYSLSSEGKIAMAITQRVGGSEFIISWQLIA